MPSASLRRRPIGVFARAATVALVAVVAMVAMMAVAAPGPAAAQDGAPYEVIGDFRDWAAATYRDEDGRRVCFIVTRPKSSSGDYSRRGAVYVQVTRREGGPVADVVSVEFGYPFADGARAQVTIDGTEFGLYTFNETAWADSADDDRALVQAMRRGRQMIAKGRSARGTETTDSYSLLGFTAAHKAMAARCG